MTILTQDAPTLRAVNPRTWIKSTDYLKWAFRPSLRAFRSQRATLMEALEPLTSKDWARMATVRGAGKVLERAVFAYAQWIARHERSHMRQIEKIAKTVPLTP
jgi:hypothetical protein